MPSVNSVFSDKGKSFTDHVLIDVTSDDIPINPVCRGFRVNSDGNIHFQDYSGQDVTLYCLAGTDQHHSAQKFYSDSDVKNIIALY